MKQSRKKRTPPPITSIYLQRYASWYMERWWPTTIRLRQKLLERVSLSISAHGGDREAAVVLVDELLEKLVRSGLLNDAEFARDWTEQLHRQGNSKLAIRAKLKQKSVPDVEIQAALNGLQGDPALASACRYVRRRRFGPYRLPEARKDRFQKDLAAMARAGHAWSVSKRVLTCQDVAELVVLEEGAAGGDT